MTYIDLGKYTFSTGPDLTGLNTGNLTSVLNLSTVRVPNFEMYRLVIDTSRLPDSAQLPSVVQTSAVAAGSSLTTLSIVFPQTTTAGNTLVVTLGTVGSSASPTASGMTIGGVADHFGQVVLAPDTVATVSEIWACPNAVATGTTVVVTMGGGSGTCRTVGVGYELANMLATSSATACADVSAHLSPASPPSVSAAVTPVNTTTGNDLQFGTALVLTGNPSLSIPFPPAPWNSTAFSFIFPGPDPTIFMSNYQPVSQAGTAMSYALATNPATTAFWSLSTATFKPTPATPASTPFAFKTCIDGITWDSQQTVAGVGYTYAIGQSPLYLNSGQNLQILWQIPVATYAALAPYITVQAWFRYDPDAQPS